MTGSAMTRRAYLAAAALSLAACAFAPSAFAQSWPTQTVKFVVPFGPGTATDIGARLIAERLQAKWGKPVVVENRAGGDGLVAINAFISANDDHVLLYSSSTSFIAHPYTLDKVPYDQERDILPIARVSAVVVALGVPASSPHKTIGDFAAAAKKEPGKLNAMGAAGLPEFALQAFLKKNALEVTRVPYRDLNQAAADLGENRIQFMSAALAVLAPLTEAGRIRVVAVSKRTGLPIMEGVQTIAESGFPELELDTVTGLYGPRTMSLELRKRIGQDVIEAVKDPTVTSRFVASYQDVMPAGPEELAQTLKRQAASAAETAKIAGVEAKKP
ncbi:MAG: hypothetical protein JWN93_54 [Hyphomicrobiales bacterium]|nr:hypothetical protein [Hyphomicrobiales bacterium]